MAFVTDKNGNFFWEFEDTVKPVAISASVHIYNPLTQGTQHNPMVKPA